jgi:hypothetical protein
MASVSAAERRRREQALAVRAIERAERKRAAAAERRSDLRVLHLSGGLDAERAARLFPSRFGRIDHQ